MPALSAPRPAVVALLLGLATLASAQETTPVRFQVNDALVKDSNLAGVTVRVAASEGEDAFAEGVTDDSGGWVAEALPLGTCYVTYAKPGYVTIEATEVEVRGDGQVVTISLLPALESEGGPDGEPLPLRVELILNWGSDPQRHVKDADSHLCSSDGQVHVFYADKHGVAANGSPLELDVDDMDWGGPETVTLNDSPPGTYLYWVHDYTGSIQHLGDSDVVVRLIEGNTLLAEYRCEPTLTARLWRPFKQLVIDCR